MIETSTACPRTIESIVRFAAHRRLAMPSRFVRRAPTWALAAAALAAAPRAAFAVQPDRRVEALEVQRTDPARVRTAAGQWKLTRDEARWQRFEAARGLDWRVRWNEVAGSPQHVWGGSLPPAALGLPGPAGPLDKQAILRLAEAFVRAETDLLGVRWEDLRPLRVAFHGGRWVVTLQQEWRGLEMVGGRVDLRFGPEGQLMLAGADVYPGPAAGLPHLAASRAAEAARAGLPGGVASGDPEPVLLPMLAGEPLPPGVRRKAAPAATPADLRVRQAFRVSVRTADPPGDWETYVDAATGEVLWRFNRVRFATVDGTVTGEVHPLSGTDPLVSTAFADEQVWGGIATGTLVSYNFESGLAGWTSDAPGARSSEAAHGGTWAWSDSPGTTYLDGADVSFTSPAIDASAVVDPVLVFWIQTALEYSYDYLYVEASGDGGASWTRLRAVGGYSGWHQESVDLSAVQGTSQLRVRFRLLTDYEVVDDGCWIDDVSIQSRGSATTQANGTYTLDTTGGNNDVTTALRGRFAEVTNIQGASASLTVPNAGPTTHFAWTTGNSLASERDMYVAAHWAHQRIQEIDPGFTDLDWALPVYVNAPEYCNAYWTGAAVVFGAGTSSGCNDLGTWQGVMLHEYGHGITAHVYSPSGCPGDMHEGFSDYFAATMTGTPDVGAGILGPGAMFRTIANHWRDPEDRAGEVHMDGTILAAAFWDLRQLLQPDVDLADHLFHFSRYGTPFSFEACFFEVLTVDDDDANLGNGTPHLTEIRSAFGNHGIGWGPELRHQATAVQDAGLGNGDGRLDPGETADLVVTVHNFGAAETGVWVRLSSATPGVTVTADSVWLGNLAAGAEVALPAGFGVEVGPAVAVGTAIVFDLALHSSLGTNADVFMAPVGWVPILLVDDDRSRVYEPYFEDSLDRLGRPHSRWEAAVLGGPTAEEMAPYCAVVWFTGVDGLTTLAPGDQAELAAYLGAGGRLFITGMNLAEDLWSGASATAADKAFYEDWLHATVDLPAETPTPSVDGVGGDPIGDGLALSLVGGTGAGNQSSAASLVLKPGAVASLRYSNGRIAALRWDGAHRVFHCGFGFESISSAALRDSVMERALRWLCPAEAVPPSVEVVQPNGGEALIGQQPYVIQWTATDQTAVLAVDIALSTDGGGNWTPIATGVPNSYSYAWTVTDVSSAECRIRVTAVDPWSQVGLDASDQDFEITATTDAAAIVPRDWALHPAVPNPFNPSTRLRFDVPQAAPVWIDVIGVDGRRLRRLVDGESFAPGTWERVWDGRDDRGRAVGSGVYLVRLQAGSRLETRKVQLLK
jgi:hypothetical protein